MRIAETAARVNVNTCPCVENVEEFTCALGMHYTMGKLNNGLVSTPRLLLQNLGMLKVHHIQSQIYDKEQ